MTRRSRLSLRVARARTQVRTWYILTVVEDCGHAPTMGQNSLNTARILRDSFRYMSRETCGKICVSQRIVKYV